MTDSSPALRQSAVVPDHPAAVSMLAQPLLGEVAGLNTAPVSLSIEYGVDLAAGESVQVEARIIRGTRTLVFAQARLMNLSGQMAADISAVFRRQTGVESAPEGST